MVDVAQTCFVDMQNGLRSPRGFTKSLESDNKLCYDEPLHVFNELLIPTVTSYVFLY